MSSSRADLFSSRQRRPGPREVTTRWETRLDTVPARRDTFGTPVPDLPGSRFRKEPAMGNPLRFRLVLALSLFAFRAHGAIFCPDGRSFMPIDNTLPWGAI